MFRANWVRVALSYGNLFNLHVARRRLGVMGGAVAMSMSLLPWAAWGQEKGNPLRNAMLSAFTEEADMAPPAAEVVERSGWLRRNDKAGSGGAEFVLVDRSGVVRHQVTSNGELDLAPFLNKQITLRGEAIPNSRGFKAIEIAKTGKQDPLANKPPREEVARPRPSRNVVQASRQEPVETPPGKAIHDKGQPLVLEDNLQPHAQEPVAEDGSVVYSDGDDYWEPGLEDMIGRPHTGLFPGNWFGCGDCCEPCGPCEQFWVRADYLMWWTPGMSAPPLVTTNARGVDPVIGVPGTIVVYGGNQLHHEPLSGFRIQAGTWLNACRTVGLEGEYFGLGPQSTRFSQFSNGSPSLGRPFFNVATGVESNEDVGFVGQRGTITGTVTVDTSTQLQSAGARLLFNACCSNRCDAIGPCGMGCAGGSRIDLILGYRYMQLDERLAIREDLTAIQPPPAGTFVVRDTFTTSNQFNGGEVGFLWQRSRGLWSVDFLTKVAIGNNRQMVTIEGSTLANPGGLGTGGLLAQTSNIGIYQRDQLSVIPELGLTLGLQVTPCLRFVCGYTFIYWSNVVRPGDQIDRNVNTNLIPPQAVPAPTTNLFPKFAFHDTDIWIQGLNLGLDYRW